jgi:DNA-binding transcriptional ArsR family regulator
MTNKSNGYHRLFFKAFSNETRFEIIKQLRKSPLTVSELCKKTGFEQSRISHNLRCLENCGFVTQSKNWKTVTYTLDNETIIPMFNLVNKHMKKYKKKLECCKVMQK